MQNEIQSYAWGRAADIPEFLRIQWPEGRPAAELWMGAHPSAPSRIEIDGQWVKLDSWIDENRKDALGDLVSRRFRRLPFLFKLLAAGKSLSIQAHPNKIAAEEGFRRENEAGIPIGHPERSYRDDNHKPEIIMALGPFTAMLGFREAADIRRGLSAMGDDVLERCFSRTVLSRLDGGADGALEGFLGELLRLDAAESAILLGAAREAAVSGSTPWSGPQTEWTGRLLDEFPGDVGAVAPLFLHIVRLRPAEALYLSAGVPHAYLDGFGVELMANSDNVLRGGLTPKNIDVPELMKVLDFRPSRPRPLLPRASSELKDIVSYPTPTEEFALGIAGPGSGATLRTSLPARAGPLIILCIEKTVELGDGKRRLVLERGESAFVPFAAPQLSIAGEGKAALAGPGR